MKVREAQKLKRYQKKGKGRTRVSENILSFDSGFIQSQLKQSSSNRRILNAFNRILNLAIEQELTPRQKEIVKLRYFENMTHQGIAEQLGIVPSTVTRTLHRAEARIQNSLKYCLLLLRTSTEEDDDE